ncbi:MAG: MFS transporter [Chloroflexi bacterium]|nr:MFS transporter [Chloroflexota bacterium]MCI0782996.1 MFS transporter [Chloroflexota bacterium]MCI0814957.1 MFS transporter [Chloroflexota bacterium]MCI0819174.1 MFS transporter [Chloroflexota bacterium]MCI0838008.1 MFS transporter [Chloroflexota bacterium]
MTAAAPDAGAMRPIAELDTRTKVLVIAGTLLGLFTAAMDQTVVATSIPKIVADLGGFGLFSWVGTGFLLASTTTVPIVGRLSDMYGRKPFFMLGIVLLLLGSALAGSSQTIEQLIAFRVIQGFGAGMIMAIAFTIVGDVFPPAERGRWMGLMAGVFAAASVLGPLIGGTLTDHADWRWVFYINLPMGGVALALLAYGMPRLRPPTTPKMDYRGIVLLCATTVPMLLAFSWAGNRFDWVSPQIIGLLAWSVAALALLVYTELRTEEPLLPMQLLKNRVFTVSGIVALLTGFAMMGSLFYIPLFVQGVLGASATSSGLVTMPMMIAMALAAGIAGQVMSRVGKYRVIGVFGLIVMVIGMAILSMVDASSSRSDVTLAMIIFGIGLGTSIPLYTLAVQNSVPYRVMGVSTSTMQFLRSVGGTMGVAIMFSVIQVQYHDGVEENVPAVVREQEQLSQALEDPQFLLNPQALEQVESSFAEFGVVGEALFVETIDVVRESLAAGVSQSFFIAIWVLCLAVVAGAFLKDEPLRKTHLMDEEEAQPTIGTEQAMPPLAGGATGDDPEAP